MNLPRVLHVVWNLIRGGTEGQCARTALALAEAGWTQRVAVSRREGFFLDRIEAACGPVQVMPITRLVAPGTALAVVRLASFIRRERMELVHAWDADAAIFGAWAARLAGVPYLTSRRDLGEIYAPRKAALMRAADRHARAVVVNAQAIADAPCCAHVPSGKVRVIPNIVDLAELDARAAAPKLTVSALPGGPVILMVARLDPEKDVATLIRAMGRVVAVQPEARLVIVGDGPERAALEASARTLAPGAVVFTGTCDEVPALLRGGSIGALTPDRNEGLSNTILEYMAARLPVVATDCGGNRELVREGATGFVVPARDDAAVADRLLRLLAEPAVARAIGTAGRKIVEEQHQSDAIAARFAALYIESLNRSQRR